VVFILQAHIDSAATPLDIWKKAAVAAAASRMSQPLKSASYGYRADRSLRSAVTASTGLFQLSASGLSTRQPTP
jgi:hypothetical protein